jgi:hypothetical protein
MARLVGCTATELLFDGGVRVPVAAVVTLERCPDSGAVKLTARRYGIKYACILPVGLSRLRAEVAAVRVECCSPMMLACEGEAIPTVTDEG